MLTYLQYTRARLVVEHASRPWTRNVFSTMKEWQLDNSGLSLEQRVGEFSFLHQTREKSFLNQKIGENARSPHCECIQCVASDILKTTFLFATYSDYDSISPKEIEKLIDHQYLLCSSHMFGFILKDRSYGKITTPSVHSWYVVDDVLLIYT